jgi:transposase
LTAAEKERLVAASLQPGAVVSAVAREAGIRPSQLYGWRRQLCVGAPGGREGELARARNEDAGTFAAVRLTSELASARVAAAAIAPSAPTAPAGVIEIEFAGGARMRISGAVDAATLSALVVALARRERRR